MSMPIQGAEIKKCQDENGQWHYGNFTDETCGATEVIKLNQKGSVVGTEAPPPTQEELDKKARARKEAAARKAKVEKQRKKDKSLVKIYVSEEVIVSTRERKLESIDNNLEVMGQLKAGIESDLAKLKERKQNDKVKKLVAERERAIKSYELVINQSLSERGDLEQKYIEILRNFQEASSRLSAGS